MDWLWPEGPAFYYDTDLVPPTTDTFLLGAFPKLKAGERVCDLGAGCGLLSVLLLAREPSLKFHNVELQPAALELAALTSAKNGWHVQQHPADLRDLGGVLQAGSFDLVVSNPPYFEEGSGLTAPAAARAAARSDGCCTLEDLCGAAARLLRWGGRFALVFRPERLTDLLVTLRQNGLEPKRLRLVCHCQGRAPVLVLVEARRGGKPGLQMEHDLILHNDDGSDTEELSDIYFRRR